MKLQFIITAMIISANLHAQTPGNIGTGNLTAWFAPDGLALGDVTAWTTTFPVGVGSITVTDLTAPYPLATNTPAGDVSNYNTTLEFTDNTLGALKALTNASSLNLLDNSSSGNQGTFFCAYYKPESSPNHHMLLYNELGNDAIQFRNLGAIGRIALGRTMGISVNAADDWTEDFEPNIISYKGNRSGAATMDSFEKSLEYTGGGASQSSGPTGIYMGVMPGNTNSPYEGYLHEYVFFNRDLTLLEMNKVHTYLAIKYGVTLDNTGGGTQGDYIATDGTIIWDASVTPTYHNDVIGIGRDDNEGLLQKQSHTFDDTTRIYLNTLEPTNAANSGAFAADISYVTIGHDEAMMCSSEETSDEIPIGFFIGSRLDREWKVTKSNIVEEFNLDFTLNYCDPLDVIDIANLRLLVDDDGDFSDAAVYATGGSLSFDYSAGVLSVLGISDTEIPNNSARYITVAYIIPELEITGTDIICPGETATLVFNVIGTATPVDIVLFDGVDEIVIPGVVDGDTYDVTPLVTTAYEIWIENIPLNCCVDPAVTAVWHLVTVTAPPVVDLGVDLTICDGDVWILDAENPGATYLWNDGSDLQTLDVFTAGVYDVVVTDADGCEGTDEITIAVETPPNAGEDISISHCNTEDPLILNDFLTLDADLGGVWVETSGDPSGTFTPGTSELTILDLTEGIYTFEYTIEGTFCPNDEMVMTVEIVDAPYPGVPVTTEICNDTEIDLDLIIDPAVDAGSWTELTASGAFNPITGVFDGDLLVAGDYLFEYTADGIGPCAATTNILTVRVKENPVITFHATIPEGCTPLETKLVNDTDFDLATDCMWVFGDGTTNTNCSGFDLYLTDVGCYGATLTMTNDGCTASLSITDVICVRPLPIADFDYNPTTIYSDNPLVNFVNNSEGYTESFWDFGDDYISLEDNPEHLFDPNTATIFEVALWVTNEYGCKDSTFKEIVINDEPLFYVPNAFTPDSDGLNPEFKPVMTAGYDPWDYHLTIYNRWGEMLFESYDAFYGWDGTFGGEIVASGVYVWAIEFGDQITDKIHPYKGLVTVSR